MANSGSDDMESQARQSARPLKRTDDPSYQREEILRSAKEAVSAAGFDSSNCRVAAILDASGQVVDVLFGDVFLHQGGLLAIVDLQASKADKSSSLHDEAEKPWLYQQARVILVAFPRSVQSDPSVWIL